MCSTTTAPPHRTGIELGPELRATGRVGKHPLPTRAIFVVCLPHTDPAPTNSARLLPAAHIQDYRGAHRETFLAMLQVGAALPTTVSLWSELDRALPRTPILSVLERCVPEQVRLPPPDGLIDVPVTAPHPFEVLHGSENDAALSERIAQPGSSGFRMSGGTWSKSKG
jgi:hypothetical protein